MAGCSWDAAAAMTGKVNCPGLVHDPAHHRAAGWGIAARGSPDVVKDIQRHFFRGAPVMDNPDNECEDQRVDATVQIAKRRLIPRGDGLHESHPFGFRGTRPERADARHLPQCGGGCISRELAGWQVDHRLSGWAHPLHCARISAPTPTP